jgi:hypothetical protein
MNIERAKQRRLATVIVGGDTTRHIRNKQPVRSAYQPPASSTFLSEQTSNQPAVLFSQNKSAPDISHQPNEQTEKCL